MFEGIPAPPGDAQPFLLLAMGIYNVIFRSAKLLASVLALLRASFLTSFMRVPAAPILLLVTTLYMGINILKPIDTLSVTDYVVPLSEMPEMLTSYVQLPKLATFVQCFLPFLATFSIHIRTTLVQILPILAII